MVVLQESQSSRTLCTGRFQYIEAGVGLLAIIEAPVIEQTVKVMIKDTFHFSSP